LRKEKNINPYIILIEPQLDENIGAVARAMLNFEFCNLRLVKKKWSVNKKSSRMSAGAEIILKNTKVFQDLKDASKDLHYLYATTNRKRSLNLPVFNLKKGIKEMNKIKNKRIGIVFGPERSGINNDDISLCDKIINIPLNKKFNSLNLSQSVLLIVYEWFNRRNNKNIRPINRKALKSELFNFFNILEDSLENKSFFRVKQKKKIMLRNIKTIFEKANLTEKEINILLGIIKVLKK
jgi:tRNA/rRNA methyltransferase